MRFGWLMVLVAIDARDAIACGAALRDDLVLDPVYADDTAPPSQPTVTWTSFVSTGTDCGDFGRVTLTVSAVDDRAPAEKLGFRLEVVSSDSDVLTPSYAVLPLGGQIFAYFAPTVESLHAQLSVRAVDLNGNIGEPMLVDVAYETPEPPQPDEGCNAGGSSGLVLALLVLARCTIRRDARPSA